MLTYDMEHREGRAKYDHLYRCIRGDIRGSVLEPHAKLPSKRDLAHHLSISVSTVERAYDMLVSEGYIEPRKGSGFFVCDGKAIADAPRHPIDEPAIDPSIEINANRCSLRLFPADTWIKIMRRVLSERNSTLFETVPFNGLMVLREAIAAHLLEFKGIHVDPECIVVGAGTEFLYQRLVQLFGRNVTMAAGEPFNKRLMQASGRGAFWDLLPVDESGLVVDALQSSQANVVHVAPANHFPIGVVMSEDRRAELMDWVHADPNRYIIEDDYDSELRYSGAQLPCLFASDEDSRVIYLNTFSKTLVPSLRISYMVLPETLMSIYRDHLGFYSCSVSSFEQQALAEFISGGYYARHIKRLCSYYGSELQAVTKAIETSKLSSIGTIFPVTIGTHLVLRVKTKLSDDEVKQEAAQRGIYLDMLSGHYIWPSANVAHCIIVNFASIEPDQIDIVVELLVDIFWDDIVG